MAQCLACFFDPCRCFAKESTVCQSCKFLQAEVEALREAVLHYRREIEREKQKRFAAEMEVFQDD